jgi:hypothetical protein
MLGTSPVFTGSAKRAITMGMVVVALLAALAAGVLIAKITSTLRPTSSPASAARRSFVPSANRHSMAIVFPSA